MRFYLVPLILLILVFACAGSSTRLGPQQTPTLFVQNNNWQMMKIYSGVDGTYARVGEAETEQTVHVPLYPTGHGTCGVTLRALAGNESWSSGEFPCMDTDTFDLRVGNMLSTAMVVPRMH